MDRFQAIQTFRAVATHGGFAAAARALNMSPPSVSRLISELENDLGVRLFNRSTRSVALTEEGEVFLSRGVTLIDELEAVSDALRERQTVPQGHLKVSSVVAFGQERVAPAIPGFMERYPKVSVALELSNRKVDLVQEHVDLALRVGDPDGLAGASLVARKIFSQTLLFVATPSYVAENGAPGSLDDLEHHRLVKQVTGNWGKVNEFRYRDGLVRHRLPERFVVNSPNAARNAVLTGQAIGLIGDFLVWDMLDDGRLVRVLPEYETLGQPIHAVFLHKAYMPAKIRVFIDHLAMVLKPAGRA